MQGKLTLAVGFVAGYVLGSKAGRQRYEEIVAQARKVAGSQTVQSTAGVLQTQAADLVNKAKESDVVSKAKQAVGRGDETYTPPTPTYAAETGSSTDLFEPTKTTTTTDPLNQRNGGTNGSAP